MTHTTPDFGIYSERILTETGFFDGTILIKNGVISKLIVGKGESEGCPIENVNNMVVMPGIIDSHVHINEPGRTEWEGFETITKAAIAGGITTLIDMPLNASPVTISKKTLEIKIDATAQKLYCNVGFWGGIVPNNIQELDQLLSSGVFGIKAFLTHSGIDDFPNVTSADLRLGLAILKEHKLPLLAHAELDYYHQGIAELDKNPTSYQAYLQSRPKEWEDNAIELMIALCEEFETPIHIVHLSSATMLDKLKAARAKGLPITVETCPHYLYFNAETIPDKNTLYKCAPPIREKANNDKLWAALIDGTIDFIVTDHSPATPLLKEIESGNLKKAWGGIAGIQFSLPIVWTEAQKRGFTLLQVSNLMSKNVAKFLGLSATKGIIKQGYDADLVVWNPEQQFTVSSNDILFRHKTTPYLGQQLYGKVHRTYVSGQLAFSKDTVLQQPHGSVLLK